MAAASRSMLAGMLCGMVSSAALGCTAPASPPKPSRTPLTQQRRDERERAPEKPLVAPPPSYGHRVVTRTPAQPMRRQSALSKVLPSDVEQSLRCVEFWPEARYRNYGYDHLVHLWNRCSVRATCDVASDVNPTPTRVELRPREAIEVLTFRGSPAREFTPKVQCRAGS
jgi:hypothetical protein